MGYKSFIPDVKDNLRSRENDLLRLIRGQAEGHAKELCPVDTDRLRGSITGDNDDTVAVIGTNVEYGPYVELGTEKMKGVHFLERGATENITEYVSMARRALKL